ncbi:MULTISPECIES: ABC transporter ATP-binding protein [unclassified Brevibacterium]|uniref:dipeptide ABC transporter ATP-binding protein n=1 Tax=unclassified Brevibacterium TaxID=2614124 RepID=UPI001E29F316|nr:MULTISPECIES: ABC transporter ATP-binding protein [unclassified Brevibacterium]MDK8433518.1 ABC transporter ATP-binding protein [Brevibacterium sp. H-BE7]
MMNEQANADRAGDEFVLEVSGLEVSYETPVLHDFGFTLEPGERLALVGQSGSGKSTTIGAVLGLLPGAGHVSSGSVKYRGEDLVRADRQRLQSLRGRSIALVPQDPMASLNPSMRVGDQIADALRTYGMKETAEVTRNVVRLMTEAGIPDAEARRRSYPHEFSGGMRQRILIAIALSGEPDLIIADEPTSALDVTVQKQILDHLADLVAERGTSLLFVTHDLGVAGERTDTILVMHEGRVVERGAPEQVLGDPQHEYTKALVKAAPSIVFERPAATVAEVRQGALGGDPTNDAGREESSGEAAATSANVLEVNDLHKVYRLRGRGREVYALKGVSFTAKRGKTTAVIGESGSGKSTIAKIVLGLEKATSGEVLADGRNVDATSRAERSILRRFSQPVFQDPFSSLNPMWSIERIIREPLDVFAIGARRQRTAKVREVLDHVALPESMLERRPADLSGGQRQRIAIARALISEPELLICDEAVSALDVLVQEQILDLLRDLQSGLGVSCLFITHDLAVVANLADDVVVMKSGEIVESGPTRDVIDRPSAVYTQKLLAAVPGSGLLNV